jgi:hypothetical protein
MIRLGAGQGAVLAAANPHIGSLGGVYTIT